MAMMARNLKKKKLIKTKEKLLQVKSKNETHGKLNRTTQKNLQNKKNIEKRTT